MKKTRFMALMLIVAVMMMGAGYAYWNNTLTVTSTVDTGKVDVNMKWAFLYTPNNTIQTAPVISADKKSITFSVNGLYPTVFDGNNRQTYADLDFLLVNDGTVPVKLKGIRMDRTNPNSLVWDHLQSQTHIFTGTFNPKAATSSFSDSKGLMGSPNPLEGLLKNLDTILMDKARNSSMKVLKGFVLMPGQGIRFGGDSDDEHSIKFWLDQSTPGGANYEGVDLGFTLAFDWEVFNK